MLQPSSLMNVAECDCCFVPGWAFSATVGMVGDLHFERCRRCGACGVTMNIVITFDISHTCVFDTKADNIWSQCKQIYHMYRLVIYYIE